MKKSASRQSVDASVSAPQDQKQTPVDLAASNQSTSRKTSMAGLAADARSLLTPSLAPSSYRSPIRPAASSNATSTLSTSPIGRSPSAQSQTLEGGAIARLRRVASNVSFASNTKAVASSTPTQEGETPLASSEELSPQDDGGAAGGSSSLKVPEIGSKRPLPGSQQRPAHPNRSPSRRKTWFGWTASEERSEEEMNRGTRLEAMPTDEAARESQGPIAVAAPADVPPTAPEAGVTDKPGEAIGGQSSWSMWRNTSKEPALKKPQAATSQEVQTGSSTGVPAEVVTKEAAKENGETLECPQTPSAGPAQSERQNKSASVSVTDGEMIGNVADSAMGNAAAPGSRLWALWPGTWVPHVSNGAAQKAGSSSSAVDKPVGNSQAEDVTDISQEAAGHSEEQEPSVPVRSSSAHPSTQGWTSWIPYVNQSSGGNLSTDSNQGQSQTAIDVDPETPLTPADEVKRAALARPDPSPPSRTASLDPSAAVLNNSTRRGWLAYFASRGARPVQSIEPGPEAMQVDFDEMNNISSLPKPPIDKDSKAKRSKQPHDLHPMSPANGTSAASSVKSTVTEALKPDPAPPTSRPVAPLTADKDKAEEVVKKSAKQAKKSGASRPPLPNMVLPSFDDTFHTLPRSLPPPAGVLKRTLSAMNAWLSSSPPDAARLRTAPKVGQSKQKDEAGLALVEQAAIRLPRAWDVVGQRSRSEKRGCQNVNRVVIISCHGWFAQSKFSMLMGSPTGTSQKFALEMRGAVMRHFQSVDGMELNPEAITLIPLSADGTVEVRTDSSFAALLSRKEWVVQLAAADAIFVACHSQGCVVGANLLARLIEQSYIQTRKTRIALLAMCGIHEGPFQHIQSMLVSSYLTYFETEAAKELFAFQSSASSVSKHYQASMRLILEAGAKVVLLASTDDQVVPLHSALFTSIDHPSILRALYIHGNSFPKLDFLTNLLTFCVRVRNAGLSDHQLLAQLSITVAGSLYGGAGHSLCYDEPKSYDLAASYLFEATHPLSEPTTRSDESHPPRLQIMPFEAPSTRKAQLSNPHLLPWSLRGLLEDRAVRATFSDEIQKLHDDFESWRPLTKTLKDVQYRLEPMRSIARPRPLPPPSPTPSNSKL